jgi:hypothetical protein
MALTIVILLAVELGGLAIVYAVLRERLRRAASAAAQSQELREEVSRLVVELNQTTERNVALVEDAIARLNEVLARADKKIGLLRREADRHDGGLELYSRLADARPAPLPGNGPPQPGGTRAARAASAGTAPAADPRSEAERLARLGFAVPLIAQRVGLPLGEVELIVQLGRRSEGAWGGDGSEGRGEPEAGGTGADDRWGSGQGEPG